MKNWNERKLAREGWATRWFLKINEEFWVMGREIEARGEINIPGRYGC